MCNNFQALEFMFKRTWQVVFWGTRNVFGVPKLPIGILPSKVGRKWCFYIAKTFTLCTSFMLRIII